MRLATILALISCLPAFGEPVMYPDGRIRDGWPISISGDGWATSKPSADLLAASGYRLATADEIEAWETAEAAAAEAAAEQAALYADPQPAVFVPRVGNEITNIVGQSQIFVDDATGDVFGLDETGSPEKTLAQKAAQNAARKAKVAAAKTAKGKGNGLGALAERVAALEALNGIK